MELINLENYNPEWSFEFKSEVALLMNALNDIAVNIHHVGSTAVKDLKSKPIIDIAVESDEFPPAKETIERLESIGYVHKGESGVKGREWFVKGQPRKFNLHYCQTGSPVVMNQIKFRDELRMNEALRKEYEKLKIANSVGKDIDDTNYALSKTALIERALKK